MLQTDRSYGAFYCVVNPEFNVEPNGAGQSKWLNEDVDPNIYNGFG
ncbi:MAG: hypothetical protein GYA43_08055 [Bacteroidales bacterium]|nr:hypothetical protein [Bacteroidales bacterium]